jgi:hypothetical protein
MFGQAEHPAVAIAVPPWSLLFAREPEPDPDLDDLPTEELESAQPGAVAPPPPQPAGRKPWGVLLLLVLVGVGAYASMNLDTLTSLLPESVQDLLGEAPPHASLPAPGEAPGPVGIPPGTPPGNPPANPLDASPTEPAPTPPQPGSPPNAPVESALVAAIPTPRFGEGQRAVVSPDPTEPGAPLSLRGDAAGTIPGPSLPAGTVVTVLDGELVADAWVYAVKTQDGLKGWFPEDRLKEQP